MTEFWSSNHDAESHRCRIVLGEKDLSVERGIGVKVRQIDTNLKSDELARINPENKIPMLVERDLKLYEGFIICEYLDERFPHPQLMPLGVTERAKARLWIHNFDKELYSLMNLILATKQGKKLESYRKELAEKLLFLTVTLGRGKYFLGNEFSMVDVAIAPLLWRLEFLGVSLPPKVAPLLKYAENIFSRPSFIHSLTATEKKMRK